MQRSLYKSKDKKIIGGVCAGLGEYFNIDITIVRLIFVLLALSGGQMILVYILGWIIIPSAKEEVVNAENEMSEEEFNRQKGNNRNVIFGLILVILGGGFLLENFHIWYWWNFGKLWPVLIITLGVLILTRAFSHKEVVYESE
ncbi:MAG: PspC domain-containing protein [candidate division Zixibacteria bacterium]|nr:PspC domain-containing protein [candidate division Zixibacteria bacterium]